MTTARTYQFKVLLSDNEKDWLQKLAEMAGLDPTNYVRQLIRREVGKSIVPNDVLVPVPVATAPPPTAAAVRKK